MGIIGSVGIVYFRLVSASFYLVEMYFLTVEFKRPFKLDTFFLYRKYLYFVIIS